MKVHLNADGCLCKCRSCIGNLATFRIVRATGSASQDRRDYELMWAAQIAKPTLHLIDGINVRRNPIVGEDS